MYLLNIMVLRFCLLRNDRLTLIACDNWGNDKRQSDYQSRVLTKK